MITRDRYLVVFSIATSILSAGLGFVDRFIESTQTLDLKIIFFSGLSVLLVVLILIFFLARDLIKKIPSRRKVSKKKSSRKKN